MNQYLWIAIATAAGLLVPFLILRWRQPAADGDDLPVHAPRTPAAHQRAGQPAQPPVETKRKPAKRFHGVSLKPCANACQAVQDIVNKRFLSDSAPPLPLAGCDQPQCKCTYEHHADRRNPENRRAGWGGFGGFVPAVPGGNRRSKGRTDRRKGS